MRERERERERERDCYKCLHNGDQGKPSSCQHDQNKVEDSIQEKRNKPTMIFMNNTKNKEWKSTKSPFGIGVLKRTI
jgi:hypothetical protein